MGFYKELKPLLILCSLVAIVPYRKPKTKEFTSNKIYSGIIMLLIIGVSVLEKSNNSYSSGDLVTPSFYDYFEYLSELLELLLISHAIYTACFFGVEEFQTTQDTLDIIDSILWTRHRLRAKRSILVKFIVINSAILVSTFGTLIYVWITYPSLGFYSLLNMIGVLYVYIIIELEYFVLAYVLARIKLFRKAIVQLHDNTSFDDVLSLVHVNNFNCDVIRCVNLIFGWNFFTTTMGFVLNLLVTIYFLRLSGFRDFLGYSLAVSLHSACVAVLIAILANKCEEINDSTEECENTAFKLVSITTDKPINNVCVMLSSQISRERTKISAAGFFYVNYAMLFMIFNLLVTYTIVLFQFIDK